ncbi:hypothetical protein TNCV_3761611 [Trichonephila clavipes]|nr:hypothetical protein TNCV_3761611 [Trichonephila clavipes]
MKRYTKDELTDMHLAYCNVRVTQWLFAQRFPRMQIQGHAFFACLQQRLSDSELFIVDKHKRERRVRTPNREEMIMDFVQSTSIPVMSGYDRLEVLHTNYNHSYRPGMHTYCPFNFFF